MIAQATGRAVIWRRRSDNALRFIAAVPLGYAVASLWAAALARVLPMSRSEATVTGTLIALLLCALFAMYAYGARSGWRATWVLGLIGMVAGGIVWWSIATTGRL